MYKCFVYIRHFPRNSALTNDFRYQITFEKLLTLTLNDRNLLANHSVFMLLTSKCHDKITAWPVITVRNVFAARLCFHRCLWFCPQGCVCVANTQEDTGQTPPGQTPSWPATPRQTPPGQTPSCSVHAGIHPPLVATAADGMHPTGMHSCF